MPNPTKELKKRLKTQARSLYDEEALTGEGFPPEMAKSFLETADKLDCVILSRTPGGAATQLITEGYDLKGYEIKSKSCNWGPMAGFLCRIPILSKDGIANVKYNYGYLKSYCDKWREKTQPGTKIKYEYGDLFQPIKITNARKNEIFKSPSLYKMGIKNEDYIEINEKLIYGVCSIEAVKMEYLLEQEPSEFWSIYLGQISAIFTDSQWEEYTGEEKWGVFSKEEAVIDKNITKKSNNSTLQKIVSKDLKDRIKKLREARKLESEKGMFFAIEGAVNPYPPYPKYKNDSYKNCVTGDYDLFACWPKTTYPLQELIRQAEFSLGKENYFSSFGKSLTLGLRPAGAFNHIYIEFIPGVPAINDLEDPEKGNINDLTELVAGTLNSIAGVAIKNDKTYANKAFHSDEGGRPKIDEIEFPIAFFLPVSSGFKFKEKRGGLIKDINEFLEFISKCAENGHRVTLSHGWFIFLIAHALTKSEYDEIVNQFAQDQEAIKQKAKEYYKKTIENKRQDCREKVLQHLLGYYTWERGKNKRKKRYKAKVSFLLRVAEIFIPFLDMNEEEKSDIIGKVEAARNFSYIYGEFEAAG
jgi:hypothetical protein